MARYRKVDPYIWNDAKFNSLSIKGKMAFIFMLTHPHMTSLGAMRATIPGLVAELPDVPEKAFREPFLKGMAKVDEKACFVWLPKFIKYNGPENPKVVKAWVKALDLLPECNLKNDLIQHVKEYLKGYSEAFQKAFAKGDRKSMPKQEQEQEYINPPIVPPKKINGKKFTPPTEKEVIQYFDEKGYSCASAKKAFQYYDTGGWKDSSGKQVRNWKQKMIAVWFKPENEKPPEQRCRFVG